MKKVYFKAIWNNVNVEVRLSDNQYLRLTTNIYYNPYELYLKDCDRIFARENPLIFSKYQIKRLNRFSSRINPICKIIVDGIEYGFSD